MAWKSFHDTSLVNATLACFLPKKAQVPNATAEYALKTSLLHHNNPSLPVERRFEVRGTHFTHRRESGLGILVFASREHAVGMGLVELGREYWGIGAYVLMVKFKPEYPPGIPFWKHFGIDKTRARATPACSHPCRVTSAKA